jgi:outer membrane protein
MTPLVIAVVLSAASPSPEAAASPPAAPAPEPGTSVLTTTSPSSTTEVVPKVLTLQQAIETAKLHQPALRQAAADAMAARQRSYEARAPLLPQLNLNLGYTRRTFNAVTGAAAGAGLGSGGATAQPPTFNTTDAFSGNLTLTQLIWDFGQTWNRFQASQSSADASQQDAETKLQTSLFGVRTAFFAARANRELVKVAKDTVANQQRHLDQVKGFVEVGTHPEIDLAQSLTDVANAKVQLIQAQNGYATSRAQLNQAMGVEGSTDYDVSDDQMPKIDGEDGTLDSLVDTAVATRPELAAYRLRIHAQQDTVSSARGAYGPALGFSTSATLAGNNLGTLGPNWNAGVVLSWNLFGGLLTQSTINEAEANLDSLVAQNDAERQQVRLDVEQAQLAIHAAIEALSAADEALKNAKDRLRLAEGRYQTGVGNIIELGDAQLALTTTAAQRVQADFAISTARAQLWHALGRA